MTTTTVTPMACRDCGHRSHGRVCNEIIDNGWTWHGCHCVAGEARQPRWLERMQQGQTKGKDMTGWRPDGDAA